MSYAERIKTIVNGLDLKKPIFNLNVLQNRIELEEESWHPDLDDNDVISFYVNRYTRRQFSDRKYSVDHTIAVKALEEDLYSCAVDMFTKTSPNKEPRRTNLYRSYCEIVRDNLYKQEFKDSIFNIYEYFWNSTRDKQITHRDNDVHRTNIYNLLCLMEKSYGKNRA